ncbi:hypothetical protein [Streptomyces sp. G1]|uniref:hypothetical protein n=1 Tax=Streptomyces sp. G1 TaxID=361572 RepID=UPI0020305DD6|nr:hypothetical protein [Streptomyces sp. G1]MCM1976415.1 hypothetical protein [Streptomyces sp. G1]
MRRGFLWDGFDAGIAAALAGDPETARDHFERVLREDPLAPWMVDAQEKTRELHALAAEAARRVPGRRPAKASGEWMVPLGLTLLGAVVDH